MATSVKIWLSVWVVLVMVLCGFAMKARGDDELEQFVMAGPRNFLMDHTNAVINICLDIWDKSNTPENVAWVREGWVKYEHESSGQIVLVYNVTLRQIAATMDPEEIQWIRTQLENNPDCRAERTWDFANFLATNQLVRKRG